MSFEANLGGPPIIFLLMCAFLLKTKVEKRGATLAYKGVNLPLLNSGITRGNLLAYFIHFLPKNPSILC